MQAQTTHTKSVEVAKTRRQARIRNRERFISFLGGDRLEVYSRSKMGSTPTGVAGEVTRVIYPTSYLPEPDLNAAFWLIVSSAVRARRSTTATSPLSKAKGCVEKTSSSPTI